MGLGASHPVAPMPRWTQPLALQAVAQLQRLTPGEPQQCMKILTKKVENLPKCFPLLQVVTDLVASRSVRDLFCEAIWESCE